MSRFLLVALLALSGCGVAAPRAEAIEVATPAPVDAQHAQIVTGTDRLWADPQRVSAVIEALFAAGARADGTEAATTAHTIAGFLAENESEAAVAVLEEWVHEQLSAQAAQEGSP